MTDKDQRRPTNAGALAGTYIIGAMLACALVGAGIGALAGAVVLCGVAGLLIGFFVGIWRVYVEFREL